MSPRRGPRTSVAGMHADWLRLVEPNGPFLTLPVLRRVWPNGLDHLDPEARAEVRRRLADFDPDDAASFTAWVEWVLTDVLSYGGRLQSGPQVPAILAHVVAEHGAVLRPDYALDDGTGRTRLLVTVHPAALRLDARPAGDRWSATPLERLALLCRATGVEVGLATNGHTWVLVWAPKRGASGTATFAADLFSEEPVLLDAFTSVLGARRFFAVAEPDQLEALLAESASAQAEVTGKLGQQVRQAVELLVAAMSRADREREGALLADVEPHHVYEASVAVLMRLVLLLYAEERGLLPLGDDLYDRTLAASTLLDQLRETQADTGDEPLERSHTSWHRLLALFRAVHAGIAHDRLRIPAYGGGLFDPERFPFLEGRRPGEAWHETPAQPLPVDDLTVLAMLSALQELRFTEGGVTETRRLTYRALDVEQVGHVYEGLLDHSAVAVHETAVGLVGKAGNEPEVALNELAHHAARGRDTFVAWLVEQTGLTTRRLERLLDSEVDAEVTRLLRAACDNDDALTERLTPYAHLLRRDLRGLPTVFPAGSMYVTQTGAKRDSGTAYTTKELADEVVEHALAPLVYSPGPAEGADPAEWKLRPAVELLDLKVCDPAVGSGAILVAACRYLADRLVEAWTAEGSPDADGDPDEVLISARRAVADRCLYGVDRDPMAVEMAKLSLWLVTLSKERPFSFLDHAIKAGDSLLGIPGLDQLRALHLDPVVGRAKVGLSLKPDAVDETVARAIDLRRRLESIPVVTVRDAEEKARLNAEAEAVLSALHTVADLVVGCALRAELPGQPPPEDQIAGSAQLVAAALDVDEPEELRAAALAQIASRARQALDAGRPDAAPHRHSLHWPLAFPEAFVDRARSGFDAMVGNPPFLGKKYWRERLGPDWDGWARRVLGEPPSKIDVAVLFFRRVFSLLNDAGCGGLIATSSLSEGNSSATSYGHISRHGVIYRARRKLPWPGAANVDISLVWFTPFAGRWRVMLDERPVDQIAPDLTAHSVAIPYRLRSELRTFIGSNNVLGDALILEPDNPWLDALRETPFLRQYVTGEDITKAALRELNRWIVDVGDLALPAVERTSATTADFLREHVRPLRTPESLRRYKGLDDRWWQLWTHNAELYRELRQRESCVVLPVVSKYVLAVRAPTDWAFTNKVCVVHEDRMDTLGLLSSGPFEIWARRFSGTMGERITLSIGASMETFPLPTSPCNGVVANWEAHRKSLLQEVPGLTPLYNRVHNMDDRSPGIAELRDLHVALDLAVRDAYGWSDLDLDHGYHDTPQGRRFTLGPSARTELLDRLLELNHQRYAEEVAAGLHGAKGKKAAGKRARQAETLL